MNVNGIDYFSLIIEVKNDLMKCKDQHEIEHILISKLDSVRNTTYLYNTLLIVS